MGGRRKGTKNKPKEPLNEWLLRLIDKNRKRLEADLDEATPSERAIVLAQLIAGVREGNGFSALISHEMRRARQEGTLDELTERLGLK